MRALRHLVLSAAFLSTLLPLAAVGGCAFSDALHRADGYAAGARWEDAADAYQEALTYDPDSAEALQGLTEARARGAQDALALGEAHRQAQRWEDALEEAARARAFLPQRTAEPAALERAVLDDLLALTRRAVQRDDLAQGWSTAEEASRLFPAEPGPREALLELWRLRLERADAQAQAGHTAQALDAYDHLGATSLGDPGEARRRAAALRLRVAEQRGAERRYQEALDLLAATTRRAQGVDLTPTRRAEEDLRRRWADDLRQRAQTHSRARHLGEAWLLYARAAAVAQRPEDLRERDALRHLLLEQHRAAVALALQGDPARITPLRRAAEDLLRSLPHTALVEPSAPQPSLRVELRLEPTRCDQSATAEVASTTFLASTRQIPNPDHLDAQRVVIQRARELQRDEAQEQERLRDVVRLQRELDRRFDREWERLNQRVDDAGDKLQRAERDREGAEDDLTRVQDRLTEARRQGQDTSSLLNDERRALDALQRERRRVNDARAALNAEMQGLHTFRRELQDAQERLERARRDLDDARTRSLQRRDALLVAQDRVISLQPLIDEPVYADFNYTVEAWTRSCHTEALLTLTHPDAPPATFPLHVARSTRDKAHPAHVKYNIPQDPLRFPQADAELQRLLDADLQRELTQRLREALERRSSDLLSAADRALASDRHRALTLYVAHLLSGSPQRRPELIRLLERDTELEGVAELVTPPGP